MDPNIPPPDDVHLPGLVLKLVEQSRSLQLEERRAAIEELYELAFKTGGKITSAIPALVDALSDADSKIGESALWALGYCKPDSMDWLTDALSHDQPIVRMRASWALGNIGEEARQAAPALRNLLEDPHQAVRERAAWALGLLRDTDPQTLAALARNISLGTHEDQSSALHAMGNIACALDDPQKLKAYQPLVLAGLEHQDSDVRWSALYVVASLGLAPEEELTLLAELLRREQTDRVIESALLL